jgi:type IV conjugative transfer system coupling protein TraD
MEAAMKRNIVNFTRGSQLLGHFGFMFASGLKAPLIIAAVLLAGMTYWQVTSGLSDNQQYLVGMNLYASLYGFMEFDPAKLVQLDIAGVGSIEMAISAVPNSPSVVMAMEALWRALRTALAISALLFLPAFVLFYWVAEYFGGRSKESKHERGAELATLPELQAEISRHNASEQGQEMKKELGWRWRLAGQKQLEQAGYYTPSKLAGVHYPWRLEQSHAMLIGTTGTGKTVALLEMIAEARRKGQRAVIFDLTGAFIEHFYDASRDVILNPLDARCPQWSVFNDCSTIAEFHSAAEAIVPQDGGGEDQFWVIGARSLFVQSCLQLKKAGTPTNEALAQKLITADLTDVHKLLKGTVAAQLTAPKAARMATSIRAVFNANAEALMLLPKHGPQFSIRDWVRGECERGGIIFISARYVDMSICSKLLTLWMDTAMNTLMSMKRTSDLRIWFMIDELGALHRLPALEKGLQTARNFGGAIVTGIHAFAKLKEVYGENMAMTLSSLARTKLILATADRETATWCSDFIGHRQIRDMEEGYSYGYNNARDAVSLTPRRQIEPLLLPDQFMNLPRLNGYIKFPDGFPAAPVKLTPQSWPRLAEGFIARAFDDPEETDENVASPAASDEGQDKAIASDTEPDTNAEDGEEGVTQSAATQHELAFAENTEIGDGEPVSDLAPELREANITDPSMDTPQKPVDEEERAQSLDPKGDGLDRADLPDPSDPANKSRSLSGPARDVGRDLREGAVRDELDRDIGEYDM